MPELIDAGLSYILAKINMGCYFKGAYRHDRYELPPDEMRELVINAFAHRSYLEHDVPVFIAIYDTRVEITSPGGLPRGQTAERAVAGFSKIRNEVLAKALHYMRFIEEWGSGLKRVNGVLRDYGIGDISMENAGFAIRTNVRRAQTSPAQGAKPKRGSATKHKNEAVNEAVNAAVNEAVNETANRVFRAIKRNPGIRKPQLLKLVKTSRATAERALAHLQAMRKIEFRGAPKTGGYFCK